MKDAKGKTRGQLEVPAGSCLQTEIISKARSLMCGIAPSKPAKSEQDYRAEDDFRTLQRAEEVRMDKSRHGRALQHGVKQITGMQRIMGRLPKSGRISKRVSKGR